MSCQLSNRPTRSSRSPMAQKEPSLSWRCLHPPRKQRKREALLMRDMRLDWQRIWWNLARKSLNRTRRRNEIKAQKSRKWLLLTSVDRSLLRKKLKLSPESAILLRQITWSVSILRRLAHKTSSLNRIKATHRTGGKTIRLRFQWSRRFLWIRS